MVPDEKTRDALRVTEAPPRLDAVGVSLLVMSKSGVYTCPLPSAGELTLGRGEDCDVRIDDRKASRVHAILRMGPPVRLVDQGSTNGTLVGGRRLAPRESVELRVGDMVTLGGTVIVLQTAPRDAAPVRVWSRQAFESLFDQARERAASEHQTFAIVQIRLDTKVLLEATGVTGTAKAEIAEEVARQEQLERVLGDALRPSDVVATFGPGRFEALLPSTDPEVGLRLAEQLGSSLKEGGFDCAIGCASYPKDGLTLMELDSFAERHLHESSERPPVGATIDGGAMKRLAPVIDRVAAGMINVLLLGETGVGKEVLARTIHERSPRAKHAIITLNCAALSETLLESELFGHEKGAFTGALQAKPGLLEAAAGGTVFMDEIGEMPMALQAKLLRVLEQREVTRVGALKPRQIDVRFVSATNRDLDAEIEQGRFRRDLYFRLNGIALTLPPLRERVDEIEPLAKVFVSTVSEQMKRPAPRISAQVLELLTHYAWPGNIRELRNMMERAVLLCSGDTILLDHLPESKMRGPVVPLRGVPTFDAESAGTIRARATTPSVRDVTAAPPAVTSAPPAALSDDDEAERRRIIAALEQCAGNQTKAAQVLGISRRTLVTRLKEYALPRPRKPV